MVAALFSHALRESSRARRVAPWLIMALGCAALAWWWPEITPRSTPKEAYVNVVAYAAVRVLALLSAIATTAVIGQEVEGRTIVYLLTRPIPRPVLVLVRFAAATLAVFVLGAIVFAATSFGAWRGEIGRNPMLLRDLGAVALGALAYGSLFLFVSLVVNRALIVCVLFAFGWETAVPNMPGDIYRASVLSYLQAIMEHPSAGTGRRGSALLAGQGATNTISPGTALVTLLGFSAVMLALSAWWFTTHEYVPREDAE